MSKPTPYLSAMFIMDPRGNSGLISLILPRSGSPGGCGMGTVLSAMLSCPLASEEDNGVQVRYGEV